MTVFFSFQGLKKYCFTVFLLAIFPRKIFCHNFLSFATYFFFPIKMLLRLFVITGWELFDYHVPWCIFLLISLQYFWVLDLCILCFFNLKKFQALFLHMLSIPLPLSIFFFFGDSTITLILGLKCATKSSLMLFKSKLFLFFFYLDSFFYYVCKLSIILKYLFLFLYLSVQDLVTAWERLAVSWPPRFGSVVP